MENNNIITNLQNNFVNVCVTLVIWTLQIMSRDTEHVMLLFSSNQHVSHGYFTENTMTNTNDVYMYINVVCMKLQFQSKYFFFPPRVYTEHEPEQNGTKNTNQ